MSYTIILVNRFSEGPELSCPINPSINLTDSLSQITKAFQNPVCLHCALRCFFFQPLGLDFLSSFIKKIDGGYIPIEFKSTHPSPAKIGGIKFQLAAYFELIRENYGIAPPYGVLEFADGEKYQIENTSALRDRLWKKVGAIASARRHPGTLRRNHNNRRRCQICEFRTICPQAFRSQAHPKPNR